MATALLSRIALQQRTGDDGRAQHPGQRAEQAVAGDALGRIARVGNGTKSVQIAAPLKRGEARAGSGGARQSVALENREPMRAGAAAVTKITAAASCIRASEVEGA